MNRNRIILLGILGFILLLALSFPLWSPYFTNVEVNEEFPAVAEESRPIATEDSAAADRSDEATPDETDNTPPLEDESAEAIPLQRGTWIEIDAVHSAEGSATIYQLGEERVIRFEDFRVTNGPDLHVILAKNTPTGILDGVGEDYVDLGALKGNVGSQNYSIPADVNLDDYQSVVIYCVPFNVVFSSAVLSAL